MACHKVDIFLCVLVHAASFGNDVAYVLMVLFKSSLLVGNIRIAVKHISSVCTGFVFLDVPRILELRAVICENNRKVFLKSSNPYGVTKVVDGFDNASLGAIGKQDNKHKATTSKKKGEQTFTFFAAAFDGIHFNNVCIRMSFHKAFKVNIGTLITIGLLIILFTRLGAFFTLFVTDTTWQIDIACFENTLVEVVI